jgi:hemerythrin
MSWKTLIPGCFGPLDRRFLSHPIEKQKADNLLKELIRYNVTKDELENAVRTFLENEGKWTVEHINEEVRKVVKWFAEAIKGKRRGKTAHGSGSKRNLVPPRKLR